MTGVKCTHVQDVVERANRPPTVRSSGHVQTRYRSSSRLCRVLAISSRCSSACKTMYWSSAGVVPSWTTTTEPQIAVPVVEIVSKVVKRCCEQFDLQRHSSRRTAAFPSTPMIRPRVKASRCHPNRLTYSPASR
ncbi:hypothetical protein TNCV_3433041 [Trichonephila clavipes]|nr:hypothetical protein TNCV_3433041 [Trichonephila clavipes]